MNYIIVNNRINIYVKDKDNYNIEYNINIYVKNKEIIFIYSNLLNGKISSTNSISYSIEELQLTNELFSLYNNIQEIFDVLKDLISNSYKPPIIDEKNNNFDLIIFVKLGKIQTITISLIEKINIFVKLIKKFMMKLNKMLIN